LYLKLYIYRKEIFLASIIKYYTDKYIRKDHIINERRIKKMKKYATQNNFEKKKNILRNDNMDCKIKKSNALVDL